jgi:hypothetical protein
MVNKGLFQIYFFATPDMSTPLEQARNLIRDLIAKINALNSTALLSMAVCYDCGKVVEREDVMDFATSK